MGDRANIVLHYELGGEIYFYTHWCGSELPVIVQQALIHGKSRWDDPSYLARIIFTTLITNDGDPTHTTGFGISPTVGDDEDRLISIHLGKQTVSIRYTTWTFKEFSEQTPLPQF